MKIKPFIFTSIGLLMSVLLYTGCNSSCSSNGILKTKDDFANSMKQCGQYAHDHHINTDSACKACFPPGNGCIQLGNPPVVVLNDTMIFYVGQGTDTIKGKDTTYYPLWLANNGGQAPNQFRLLYTTTNSSSGQTVHHNTYIVVGPALPIVAYDYRIAIPLTQYSDPRSNSGINMTGPNLTNSSNGGSSGAIENKK